MDEPEPTSGSPAVPDRPGLSKASARAPAPTADATFDAFYRRFVPTLVAFLMWQGARLADAADLAQVTMIEANKYWSTIREPEAWARRVASRALARHIARVEEDLADEVSEHSSLLPPLTNVTAWEQRHDVLRLLELLPPRQRQVMAWTLEEFRPAEIAKELKITPEAVRANLMKARKTLARELAKERGTTRDER